MAAPAIYPQSRRHMVWSPNFAACRELADRLGVALAPDSPLDFPAGAMFWARPAALAPLLGLALRFEDFEDEAGQQDATLAHAVERLFFYACELAGRRWIRVGGGGEIWPDRWFRPDSPLALRRCVTDLGRTVLLPGRPPHPTRTARPPPKDPKAAFREACRAELDAFLASGARLQLPTAATPEVSVVMLTFNEAELTLQCLRSLRVGLDRPAEVVIVDNASSDRTAALLERLDGARIARNAENLHFVRGVNQGAALARGGAILLLNNDARVRPGSIGAAWARLAEEPEVAAVCGRIVLPDGTLQEAGSIVWRDGSCVGHGRGLDPEDGAFQFQRDVDYGSGAFLMIRRSAFEALGGLDEAFAPAYYEETDLCMRLRAAGLRVVYEPAVLAWHFEFGSAGSAAAFALQAEHQRIFVARHAEALARVHHPPGTSELIARMRDAPRRRLLILDDQVPYPHLGAGYPRALELLRAAHDAGWQVTFYPVIFRDADYATAYAGVLPKDVEIAAEHGRDGLAGFLRARAGYYDAVLVSRPHNMQALEAASRAAPEALDRRRLIYDAEAIFAAREDLTSDAGAAAAQAAIQAEAALARPAAVVLAVSGTDAAAFRAAGARDVRVLGHALRPAPTPEPFARRRELLFVGALDEDDSPNVDSLVFFLDEVAPRLDGLIGDDWVLHVAGRNAAAPLRGRGSPRVRLLGPVQDLTPLYAGARMFIAPTRFAAGIPMKVHQAAAHGVPTVATSLLARQLGWSDGTELLAADDPQAFAEACARLYGDAALWARIRDGALAAVARDCSPEAFRRTVAEALAAVGG
jgi:GT2 family glycosyltransferase